MGLLVSWELWLNIPYQINILCFLYSLFNHGGICFCESGCYFLGLCSFVLLSCLANFFVILQILLMQHVGMKLGQRSLQAHGMEMRRMINSVDALIILALIGSVFLKEFVIILLRCGRGG